MIEKGSMFKAWEATTEQQKKAHEMQAIYKAQETARQAIQEVMNRYIKKKTRARSVAKAEVDPFAELEGWESLEQIQEAYGYGEITSDRRDKLTDPLSPARAAIATAMQAAKVSEVTGAPLPKPLTWKRGFYDTTRTFPSGWYECPVCGCRVDWEPEQCPKCYTRLEPEETEG